MKIWLDAQLSPSLAKWMKDAFALEETFAVQLDEILKRAKDRDVFERARAAGAVVMTKDYDFVDLLERLGPPPQVLWVTCGNTSNRKMRQVLATAMPQALALLRRGEPLVEISGPG